MLQMRLTRVDEAEAELARARDEIRRLEDHIAELCASPFHSEGIDIVNMKERLNEFEKKDKVQTEQLRYLQHKLSNEGLELKALAREKELLDKQLSSLRNENAQLKLEADSARRGTSVLREQIALYSAGTEGEGGVPPEELEQCV